MKRRAAVEKSDVETWQQVVADVFGNKQTTHIHSLAELNGALYLSSS